MAEIRKIANFELLERIGQGGMGTVFKARQISMDRMVALKILPPSLARQKKFIERFMREARASARLNHPNIVNGIDVGNENGLYYFAMEYVEGENLKEAVKKGRLSEDRVIEIGKSMGLALAHAHANGILHRDIKPDNILIDQNHTPKLCDLGLARLDNDAEEEKNLTQQGQAVGTPHYISPEQARGDRDLDAKTDLYSLGATLYHIITGVTPFDGATSVVVMTKHITEKVPHPTELGIHLSKNMIAVLAKLLTKDRADRYPSAQELADDFARMANGKPPIHADLPASKWPFTGSAPSAAPPRKPGTTISVGEKQRHTRREIRPAQSLTTRVIAPLVLLLLVAAGATFVLRSRSQKAERLTAEARDVAAKAAAAVIARPIAKPPEQKPVASRVAPNAEPVGFRKPFDPMARVAPQAEAVGFKTPMMAAPKSHLVSADKNEASSGAEKVPKPDPAVAKTDEPGEKTAPKGIVIPDIKAPPPEKINPGAEVAALLTKALLLSNESKYKEAAALFALTPSKLEALDDLDRACVVIHQDGYNALVEMKQSILDGLKRDPNRIDVSKIFVKKMIGTLSGGDETKLTIKGPSFEMKWDWHKLSLEELQNLNTAVLGSLAPGTSLGMGVVSYDKGEDATARKCITGNTHPSAKKLVEVLDLRDKALIAKKAAEKNEMAEKILAEVDSAMAEGNFQTVVTKATLLRVVYADTEAVKPAVENLSAMMETAMLAFKTGSIIQPGNVALSTNGSTVSGGVSNGAMIDGDSTGFTGRTGFANLAFGDVAVITLPKVYLLREIRLLLYDLDPLRFYRYNIDVSTDGDTFVPLENRSRGLWRSWQTLTFTARPVKAIRITGLYNSANAGVHVVELESYCIPPDKPAVPRHPSVPPSADPDAEKTK